VAGARELTCRYRINWVLARKQPSLRPGDAIPVAQRSTASSHCDPRRTRSRTRPSKKPRLSRPPKARRCWHVQGWRLRISSAAMDRRGARPCVGGDMSVERCRLHLRMSQKHLNHAARIGMLSVLHTWGAGRGPLARWRALDRLPARLLPPRARALAPVPQAGPGEARRRSLCTTAAVLLKARRTHQCTSLRGLFGAAA
jgi:hypothetical protein